jgi:hypothetical protein
MIRRWSERTMAFSSVHSERTRGRRGRVGVVRVRQPRNGADARSDRSRAVAEVPGSESGGRSPGRRFLGRCGGLRRTLHVTALALGLALGALTGCQADEPVADPAPSVSSSVSSPSPSESSSPAAAETPEEFIRRWINVHTEMQNTGETQEFRKLSTGCVPCYDLADQVDEIYQEGGFVETDGWTPTSFKRLGPSGRSMTYLVGIENAATEYKETSGAEVTTLPAGTGVERFEIQRRKGSFVVRNISEQST